jgi:YggT family protein
VAFVATFLRLLLLAIWLLVLGRVLWSWIDPRYGSPAGRFLFQMTEPLLAPIRQLLPRTGMVDLSPVVLMIVLTVLVRVIVIS